MHMHHISYVKEHMEKNVCVTKKALVICTESHIVRSVYIIRNNFMFHSNGHKPLQALGDETGSQHWKHVVPMS